MKNDDIEAFLEAALYAALTIGWLVFMHAMGWDNGR